MTVTTAPTADTTAPVSIDFLADIVTYRDEIIAAYGESDKAGKAKIRTRLSDTLMSAVRDLDMIKAKAAQEILESLKSVSASTPAADTTAAVAARIISLRMAADVLAYGMHTPDGIASADVDYARLSALLDEHADRANSDTEWESAEKLAKSKITRRATSGDRRDIGDWLTRAADNMRTGQFATISQLVQLGIDTDSDDTYRPSAGAINARLYPSKGDVTLDLIMIGLELATSATGVRGVRKI